MLSEFIPKAEGMLISALSQNIKDSRVSSTSERNEHDRKQAEKRVEDGLEILKQIDENGESVGVMVNVMLVLGNSEEALKKNSEKLINTAIGLRCNLRQIPFFQEDGFITISPYGYTTEIVKELAGRVTLLSTYVGGFFNLSEGFSDEQGFYFAKDINGKLMILDLWKRGGDRTNSNIVAVGAPGKGKSTAIKKIILNEYMLGTKILIIDPEREYDDIVKKLGGDWINLGGSTKGKINPLEIKPLPIDNKEDEENDEEDTVSALALHLQNLEVFFSLCFSEITERQKSIINQSLIKLYERFDINWETDISKLK
ncbi:MAG: type IV secretory system conjugative DNA transfer family protein, partial [Eubacteriales bacterium]|nr:type IV secretory system conjugative DNA transfer family protein [Eubacteriales bacterium]